MRKQNMRREVLTSRKEQILEAALHLFSTKGYMQTSIRDIATKIGVNVATIYYYFSNKEEILYAIIEKRTRRLIEKLREIQTQIADALLALKAMIKFQVLYSLENWEGAKLIVVESEHNLHGECLEKCRRLQRELYLIYLQQIEKLKAEGKARNINSKIAVFSIFGILNWLHRWYKKGEGLEESVIADSIVELFFYGILKAEDNKDCNLESKH